MKKVLALLLSMMAAFPALAGQDKPISTDKLPTKAKEFIATHFDNSQISLATMDKELFDTTYEVFFTNGSKIEFTSNGEWKEIDCKYSQMPENALPQPIREYIAANQPGRYVRQIDRDKRDYEVKLDNGIELKFDLKFRLIGYDN